MSPVCIMKTDSFRAFDAHHVIINTSGVMCWWSFLHFLFQCCCRPLYIYLYTPTRQWRRILCWQTTWDDDDWQQQQLVRDSASNFSDFYLKYLDDLLSIKLEKKKRLAIINREENRPTGHIYKTTYIPEPQIDIAGCRLDSWNNLQISRIESGIRRKIDELQTSDTTVLAIFECPPNFT